MSVHVQQLSFFFCLPAYTLSLSFDVTLQVRSATKTAVKMKMKKL